MLRKREKMKMALLGIMGMLTGMLCLTGCSGNKGTKESKTPQALAVVLGAHANSQGLNLNNVMVQDTVVNAVKSNGYVSVVCVDGEPELLAANLYEIPEQYANGNKSKLESDALMKANNMLMELETVKADDPESDVLESLRLAVRSLADMNDMEKSILIIDSGLSTTGVMDFKGNLIMADPDNLAEKLYEKSAIPNFDGITVIWMQMGDTAAPQQDLTNAQRKNLSAIWKAIIEKGGGTFICSEAPANPVDKGTEYPSVTAVTLPEETPIAFDVSAVESADASGKGASLFQTPQVLSEEQVQFVGDSDQYVDEKQAVAVMNPIAEYLKKHQDIRLLLVGTTAGDETTDFSLKLSRARADTVKGTLVELGVPSGNIMTLGLGSNDPWHIYGVGTAMNDPMARANRKVVLMDASSKAALELLDF